MRLAPLVTAACLALFQIGPAAAAADPRGEWRVEDASNGRNGDYHSTPWTFEGGGIVHAQPHWSGYWAPMADGNVFVIIVTRGRVVDSFRVVFDQGGFTARKDGRDYRYAIRNAASGSTGGPDAGSGAIRVLSATYGGNCGAASGNATAHIASACNGKTDCGYVIDYKVIGDPVVGCSKDYRVEYGCGDGRLRSASASPEAGFRKRVDLGCR